MRRFLAARFAHAAIVIVIVTTIAFLLLRLAPGEPFGYEDGSMSPALQARWRAAFGYDRPLHEQFIRYVGNVARGDFGYSTIQRRPVRDAVADALPRTLTLAVFGIALAAIIGTAVGVVAATKPRSMRDRVISTLSVVVYSIPDFWLALIIQLGLGFGLGLFPISGMADPMIADYGSPAQVFADRARHLVMPVLTLTMLIAVILARFQRAALIDVMPSDFLRTVRAKGATEGTVVRHALRNSLMPTITMLGLLVPSVLGGIYFVEYVFNWPGLGLLTVTAVQNLDYDVATASVIISGVLVAAGSLAADILAAVADPRIRDA
ncbi:MAG TPA: ABC transporter permease [Gemmatimonadaceae bacterium]|nr:ABC transporter permease [Gemmatimonadaceae bacterium]